MRVSILSARPIGERCIAWAKENLPEGVVLTDDNPDVIISVMYDKLIDTTVRAYNFHPGILPHYRGSGAYSWVLINGDVETGVTLHEIDGDIDHGAIIAITRFPVEPYDTAETLFKKAMDRLFEMFKKWFPYIINNQYDAIEQDKWRGRMYYRRDLEREKDLTRFAKAFSFEGKENAYYFNRRGERIELQW